MTVRWRAFRGLLAARDGGFSLPEILVGVTLSGLISIATISTVFTANDLGRRADKR